jgi:glycogen synthase
VHEGIVGGVKVMFLHHADIFPTPYCDGNAANTIRQVSVFGKACLELLCLRGIVPAILLTNDWFAGFIAAYAKIGAFGTTFKGTTFMHVCHNLMEDYEGRIYPEPRDGFL